MKVPSSNVVQFAPQGAASADMPDQKYLMMAAALMHQEGRLVEPIHDEMEYGVIEERTDKDGADTIRSLDDLMKGPYYKDWMERGREKGIEELERLKNKDQYPTPNKPMQIGIG